jgi:hypothetical protein
MRRWFILFLFSFWMAGTAVVLARPTSGPTTINLRACVDAGDGACLTAGDTYVDGVGVCFYRGGEEPRCGGTEDGEHWFDSQPTGSYFAYASFIPEGYQLAGITVTTFPNLPYEPANYQANKQQVHFVVKKDVIAVNVNFLLLPAGD